MLHLLYFPLYVFYVVVFLLVIYRWRFFAIDGVRKEHLAFFFLLKVAAGVLLTLIYTWYYPDQSKSDIYRYFRDSKIISMVLFKDPLAWVRIMSGIGIYNSNTFNYIADTLHFSHPIADIVTNNTFIIRLISVLNYFSFCNIYIDTLFFNFITFTGLTALFKVLRIYFAGFQNLLFIPLFLIPSVIFWSSGLLKESLLLFGIGIYLYAWHRSIESRTWVNALILVPALFIVAATKIYVAIVLAPCSIFLPFNIWTKPRSYPLARRILILLFIIFLGWYKFGNNFCETLINKRNEFTILALKENAGSVVDNRLIECKNCENLLPLIPSATVDAVLRPLPWDKGPALQYLFAFENSLILLALLATLALFFKSPDLRKLYMILFCLLFAGFNYLVIGITVPVMGAIVHYRVIAIPFLIIGVLMMVDEKAIKRRIN